ncbi:bifunctional protein-serine/threonine kinase/phosphatase [Reinekea sp.]|uniref:bifunctional protein-serine/threonine kinase/phosphatase n=1 Tax=Reinekea sp. TaxID=1970455 RepID=UPI002A82818F|nr:bifunctional protein-serine/threonine kinase/phosphatase [Reinekea sp.]
MPSPLRVSLGQYSDRGRKSVNQDFYGACVPTNAQLVLKGVALALADGISSSDVSQVASESAVTNFLADYYCTSDAWSVQHSVQQVLSASNSWLYAQTQQSPYRDDKNRGYVCTFSALVIKSNRAYIFHIGDSRIYRLSEQGVEQLTKDHRRWVDPEHSYLSRALGIDAHCELEYEVQRIEVGDTFVMVTDGVYEHVDIPQFAQSLNYLDDDLDLAAKRLVERAYEQGSSDNLTAQILRIDELPVQVASEVQQQIDTLPFPPTLEPRANFDGYTIVRTLHGSSRSHLYLAQDSASQSQVVLKVPSIDMRADMEYLERFLTEEWIARRINSAHVLKAALQGRQRHYLYTVAEYVDGQTLAQWQVDHPRPELDRVRALVDQIAAGLRAFHRMDMLHQDLKPDNILIDRAGTVKIIDFGSVRVAGLLEKEPDRLHNHLLGTLMYTAPEYFLGHAGTNRSELFSLAVITYSLLSGRYPYGTDVSKARTLKAQRRLVYRSLLVADREIPVWVDDAIRKAVHPNPLKRQEAISEFLFDLRHPNPAFLATGRAPLLERNPVRFWQVMSALLAVLVLVLLGR